MNFRWTPERVDVLRRMREDGVPAGRIAAELGCSRSAVLGKAHRLGIEAPVKVAAAPGSTPTRAAQPRAATAGVMLLDEIMAIPVAVGVRVNELRLSHCRWVETPGAPWVFCGELVVRGSYCGCHAARVYSGAREEPEP